VARNTKPRRPRPEATDTPSAQSSTPASEPAAGDSRAE
jgi:hypothetical protein